MSVDDLSPIGLDLLCTSHYLPIYSVAGLRNPLVALSRLDVRLGFDVKFVLLCNADCERSTLHR